MQTKQCVMCGELITRTSFFGYTPLCDDDECNKEYESQERARYEEAQMDAAEDDYSRYM